MNSRTIKEAMKKRYSAKHDGGNDSEEYDDDYAEQLVYEYTDDSVNTDPLPVESAQEIQSEENDRDHAEQLVYEYTDDSVTTDPLPVESAQEIQSEEPIVNEVSSLVLRDTIRKESV